MALIENIKMAEALAILRMERSSQAGF
jgi:hypothetical protein